MSCTFGWYTVFYGLYRNFSTVAGTFGKCNNLTDCVSDYCQLSQNQGVDWICFSSGIGTTLPPEEILPFVWTWPVILLVVVLVLLTIYSIVITILWNERRVKEKESVPLLESRSMYRNVI